MPDLLPYATSERSIDLVAVQRAVDGHRPRPVLNEEELQRAAELLTERGFGSREIGVRIGANARTVVRWRRTWRT